MNFKISDWPFRSMTNSLHVEMENEVKSEGDQKEISAAVFDYKDASGSIVWMQVVLNSVVSYHKLIYIYY